MPLSLMIGLFVCLCTLPGLAGEVRTWTGNNGVKVQAELIEVRGETIVLRPTDGRPDTITPMNRLSNADQVYVLTHSLQPQPVVILLPDAARDEPRSPSRQKFDALFARQSKLKLGLGLFVLVATSFLLDVWSLMVAARTLGASTGMLDTLRVWFLRSLCWIPVVVLFAVVRNNWIDQHSWIIAVALISVSSLVVGHLYRRGILSGLCINVLSVVISVVISMAISLVVFLAIFLMSSISQ